MHNTGRPCYQDDRRIEMTAYMGPRRGGKRNFNENYGNPRGSLLDYKVEADREYQVDFG